MLDMDKTVLLITGCIKPNLNAFQLSLTDVNQRLRQYIACIKWSVDNTLFKNIVFVDNSGYPVDTMMIEYASEKGKNLEWLSFIGNEKMITACGKGYGEGEIIEYALRCSELLRKATYFCKLTGRLRVDNITRFTKLADINKIYFWTIGLNCKIKLSDGIETRFYGMSIKVYRDVFIDAYKDVDDKAGMWLEKVFYRRYCTSAVESQSLFWYPDFSGQSGSMGVDYKMSRQMLAGKTLAAAVGLYCPRKKDKRRRKMFLYGKKSEGTKECINRIDK